MSMCGQTLPCPKCDNIITVPLTKVASGTIVAGFKVEKLLGEGGMGEVWLARQVAMDRTVALKILSPKLACNEAFVGRFLKEVKLSAKLDHPNIITAYDGGEDKGVYYLAVSFVDGIELQEKLAKDKIIPEKEALGYIRGVASALDYAWKEFNILHRDIKPGNIMIDKNGVAKLMDMGISKSTKDTDDHALTMTGTVVGTPYYMSPEQGMAEPDIDFRADMYSLGATLYHLVTGVVPFDAETTMAVLSKHITAPLPPAKSRNPKLSDAVSNLLDKLMAKKKDDRFQDWAGALAAIDDILESNASGKSAVPDRKLKISGMPGRPTTPPPMGKARLPSIAKPSKPNLPPISAEIKVPPSNTEINRAVKAKVRQERKIRRKNSKVFKLLIVLFISAVFLGCIGAAAMYVISQLPSDMGPVDPITLKPAIVREVDEALKKVNPNYTGNGVYTVKDDKIVAANFSTSDISDISPLKGLPIEALDLEFSGVKDISPLRGMPLRKLDLLRSNVQDISPLRGMKFETLNLAGTKVKDISALKGMPLKVLSLSGTGIMDLKSLQGAPLSYLDLNGCKVSSLKPLAGMNLNTLKVYGANISNLYDLTGMPISKLVIGGCNSITNFYPLLKLPKLKELVVDASQAPKVSFLKSSKSGLEIKTIQ